MQLAAEKKANPLISRLQLAPEGSLSLVGYANVRDTADINKMIYSPLAKQILGPDVKLLWGAKPADGMQQKNIFELYAIKVPTSD